VTVATATETAAERLDAKRAALLLRQQELRELLETAPTEIAMARELWHRSESAADERRLKAAKKAQSAAASELVEVESDLFAIDRLLAEELAKEQAAARERLAARLGELAGAEADAFRICADIFAHLYEAWLEFSATQEALQSQWWVSPGREGVQPGHLLDPTPVDFAALLSILYRSALNRHGVGYQQLERINHLVPDLGSDTVLELGGNGVQPLRGF
jgi:hypothetical protein